MPYLQTEIAQAHSNLQNGQIALTRLQGELADLIEERDDAIALRDSSQAPLTTYAAEITEYEIKAPQLQQALTDESNFNAQAASHASQAQAYRAQMPSIQAQIDPLLPIAAQIPPLENQRQDLQNQKSGREIYLNYLFSIYPEDYPGGPEYWQIDVNDTQNQIGMLEYDIANVQWQIDNLQSQIAPLADLQYQLYTLQDNAVYHEGQHSAYAQAAANRRTVINTLQPRVNQLSQLLANLPTWRSNLQSALQTLEYVNVAIPAKQGSILSEQGYVTHWNTIYTRLVGYVTEIERTPMNRPALVQTAAQIATEVQTRQTQVDSARARRADALRRREVILAAKGQRYSDLSALNNEIASLTTQITTLTGQIGEKQTEANNKALLKEQKATQIGNRPPRPRPIQKPNGEYNEAEVEAYWAWWDALDILKDQYQTLLNQELTARQEQIALETTRTGVETQRGALQTQANTIQGEMNALDEEYVTQGHYADFAQAEVSTVEPVLAEYRVAREGATARLMGNLPSNLPLLLFPVRVETRFATEGANSFLRVRIYPDDIHVDSHEPGLTPEEQNWGSHFWQATTTGTTAIRRAAWEQLATRFGHTRAAWIARYFAEGLSLPPRPASWSRAAYSEVLPDYWAVVAYRGDQVELTAWTLARVQDPLPVGPSPASQATDPFLDPAIAWLTDFTQAVNAGMALQIPITATQTQKGFDRLVVVGVKAFLATKESWQSTDAQEGVTRLTRLLDAHHYTRGLAFVRQATPTNNTAEQPSGYSPPDPLDESSYDLERGTDLISANDGSDGAWVAAALGLTPATFAHIRHANNREQDDARLASSALWSAFQSYFLEAILNAPTAAASESHFTNNVRGRGAFPTLRVGNQPYGMIPVTSLERWVTEAGQEENTLAPRIRAQRSRWRLAGERAAHSGRRDSMIRLLQHQPGASRYQFAGFGGVNRNGTLQAANVVAPFAARLNALNSRSAEEHQALVTETLDSASFRLDAWATSLATRRLRNRAANGILLGGYGWVEGVRPASPRANYGYLQAPSVGQATTAAILRSGYLTHRQNGNGDALAIDLSSDRVRRARWLLDGVREGQSLAALLGYRFERALQVNSLAHYIAPFRTLAVLVDDDALTRAIRDERLTEKAYGEAQENLVTVTREFNTATNIESAAQAAVTATTSARDRQQSLLNDLQNAYHQIAVWQEQINTATQAIVNHQANKPQARTNRRDHTLPPHVDGDVVLPVALTLSQWQATLRALQTEKANKVAGKQTAIATVDRLAGGAGQYENRVQALQTKRNELNTELGGLQTVLNNATATRVQWEIALNGEDGNGGATAATEAARVAWVNAGAALRDLLEERWQKATESIAAHNVVDGFELHRRWKIGRDAAPPVWNAATIPWGDALMGLPPLDSPEQVALDKQLRALDETVDAVSDLLVAEGVHQLAQGNPVRAGTTLEAIASGKVAPPDLEVIRTPRTGTALTYRVMTLTPATVSATPPWGVAAQNPRASAEPYLNQWVATLLPNPATVRCPVRFLDPTTGEPVGNTTLTLNVLGGSPLDFLTLPESNGVAQQSELEQRLGYYARRSAPASVPITAQIQLDFARGTGWDVAVLSVGEFLEALRVVRALVATGRAADARDLEQSGQGLATGVQLTELESRATATRAAFQQAHQNLVLITPTTPADTSRTRLVRAAEFGISGAIPDHATGDSAAVRADLATQAAQVAQLMLQQWDALLQHESQSPGTDITAQRDHQMRRIQLLLGDGFLVLPTFTPPASAVPTFDPARQLTGTDPLAAVQWVQRLSHVRTGIARLQEAITNAEALGSGATFSLKVGQLPYQAGEKWLALPVPTGTPFPSGRLSLVVQGPSALTFGAPLVGMVLDEWTELMPNATEITGVAFHYNQPNAQPPQSLLLAVAPNISAGRLPAAWDLDTLTDTLRETATLARVRVATPEALNGGLWYTARQNDGSWNPFTLIDEAAGTPDHWQSVGVAVLPNHTLHIVGTTQAGELWYAMRDANEAWTPVSNLGTLVGNRGAFRDVVATVVGNTVHICAISPTGLWHSIRFEDGSWQAFGDVAGAAGYRGVPQRVACAGQGLEFHLLLVTRDGKLWYSKRHADQSWTPFADVEGYTGDRGFIVTVGAAVVNTDLHICATSTTGVWHGVRWANGTWSAFGDIRGQVGTRGYVEEVACAGNGADLYLRTALSDGSVWHTTRLGNGGWTPLEELPGIGQARRVACAVAEGVWHLLDLSQPPLPTTLHFASNALDLSALPG